MDKRKRTIDGLPVRSAPRRRSVGFVEGEKEREMRALGVTGARVKVRVQKPAVEEKAEQMSPRRQTIGIGEEVKPVDKIGEFLEEVKDENPTELEMDSDTKPKKGRRKDGAPRKKRKIVRWAIIGVAVLLLGMAAWKGKEIWDAVNGAISAATGGRVGAGDVLAADPTVPLRQDANGRTNILVFGTSGYDMDATDEHDGGQLADSIMVISLNQYEGDVKMVSIPRDLVSETRCTATAKMNEVYVCEYSKYLRDARYGEVADNPDGLAELRWEYEVKAAEKFVEVTGEITGLDIQYWAHINWGALVGIVDALGGIDIAIEYEGNRDSYAGDLSVIWTTDPRGLKDNIVSFDAGTTAHLDGATALELSRSRNSGTNSYNQYGLNGNWSREQNQQAILAAIVQKAKATNIVTNIDTVLDIIRSLGTYIRMSFDAEGIRRMVHIAGEIDIVNMQTVDIALLLRTGMLPVPGVNSYECGGVTPGCLSYVLPKAGTYNYNEIAAFVAKSLVRNLVEEEGAVVDVLNGTGASGVAARWADELRDTGMTVGVVGNTPEGEEYGETMIYKVGDITKPATEKKLLEKYGVAKMNTGALPEGVESTANFVVIIGLDKA